MLPIGSICNLNSLICSFLKLLRDMVNFQMLHIGENNFKSLQLWTFHCLRFKELLDEIRLKFTAFCYGEKIFVESGILELISGFYPWDLM